MSCTTLYYYYYYYYYYLLGFEYNSGLCLFCHTKQNVRVLMVRMVVLNMLNDAFQRDNIKMDHKELCEVNYII